MQRKILIADYVHPVLFKGMRALGFQVLHAPELEYDRLLAWVGPYYGIIVDSATKVDQSMLQHADQLKFVGRPGVGMDRVDLAACAARGIAVLNTPGANANAVAEHMFGMLLSLLRHIVVADHEVRGGHWFRDKNRGTELRGKTIGIIGFGNTGGRFATKFAGWETRLLAYDAYKTHYAEHLRFVEETTLQRVIHESDIVSLHVPLTDETYHMVNEDFLKQCKQGVVLLNSARGAVVDTKALLEALQTGQVGGACLDVLENEKPATYSGAERDLYTTLQAMPNVIFSPHIAGRTHASKRQISRQLLDHISVWIETQNV